MNWENLESAEQLDTLKEKSKEKPVLIFKHSTSCSISRASLDRIERNWKQDEMSGVEPVYLDLLRHRNISNLIAEVFSVQHESPQILLIENGKSIYDRSHFDISYQDLREFAKKKFAS